MTLPSGSVSSASALRSVKPSPRFEGRIYAGLRLTVYSLPPFEKTSVTCVGVSGEAYCERSSPTSRIAPLGSPYSAKVMASNMVVLPAPVSPVIRYSPRSPSFVMSMHTSPAYGPNADIFNCSGLIAVHPLCRPLFQ